MQKSIHSITIVWKQQNHRKPKKQQRQFYHGWIKKHRKKSFAQWPAAPPLRSVPCLIAWRGIHSSHPGHDPSGFRPSFRNLDKDYSTIQELPVHSFHGAPGFLLFGVRKESETSRSLRYSIHHETNWNWNYEANLNNFFF